MKKLFYPITVLILHTAVTITQAQNPIIRDQYSADPSARVFGDKVYLYPSHDILGAPGQGRPGWFCMEDYHVFSSADLNNWQDHGVIIHQDKVDWVKPTSYSLWAPDCIYKNGKYYFYFPAPAKDTTLGRGFFIGVAVSDYPEGPFVPQPAPIKNVRGIDPNVFIDRDGKAYLYWSAGHIFVAGLRDDLLELETEPVIIPNLPEKGLKEGPFMFERNGIYYLTYPHVENQIERLEYATGDNPMGPFTMKGVIMDESPTGCWTNHHSFIQYNEQWYLFYHHNDYSPKFDKNRSVRIDSMFFNTDGSIQKVIPSLRGVGLSDPLQTIQIDRYSKLSDKGASLSFLDTLNTFAGWKLHLNEKGSWVQYNAVDFQKEKLKTVQVHVRSGQESIVEIRLNSADGPLMAEIKVPVNTDWTTLESKISKYPMGIHNLVVVLKGNGPVMIDWIKFGKTAKESGYSVE